MKDRLQYNPEEAIRMIRAHKNLEGAYRAFIKDHPIEDEKHLKSAVKHLGTYLRQFRDFIPNNIRRSFLLDEECAESLLEKKKEKLKQLRYENRPKLRLVK